MENSLHRIRQFLDTHRPETPCLVIDLAAVRRQYRQLSDAFPGARLHYAVKANPAPDILRVLAGLGACFDAASVPEIRLCLQAGAPPENIAYGNTIKKPSDIATAFALGVRTFTTDSRTDMEVIAAAAPGARVFCRILLGDSGTALPFGRKFGCSPERAIELLTAAPAFGLCPTGVSFHVGSQQLDPHAWESAIARAATVAAKLATLDIALPLINIGGGLPAHYRDDTLGGQPTQATPPPLATYAQVISDALATHFTAMNLPVPDLMLEPGRFLVAEAGVLRSEVVLVSRKSDTDEHRWVYLDVGRFGGLAETNNDYIAYRLLTPNRSGAMGPVMLAGPTCDGEDVWYRHTSYRLPLGLQPGDVVDVLGAGAYTASYASVCFNGFSPMQTYCFE